ncbi:diguanylate cyclase [Crenobacter intestini]|uniref:Diguanylate cyclase DosC n=1 Tax=Crenobacter intestini TaxID=2563443 RepID=A0A4T0V1F9_9NEIS|nr:diguanylate cyclase [Crenobacter intestini]TIC85358.1 diguanylate cyclase [Crenobacter intestini]
MQQDVPTNPHYTREEWLRLIGETPPPLRALIRALAETHRAALADHFYRHMLATDEGRQFLDHDTVNTRLRHSMQHWLVELFRCDGEADIDAAIAHQRHVGEVHARIHLPVHLMTRGARQLRQQLYRLLAAQDLPRQALTRAHAYVCETIDLAMELMNAAYTRSTARQTRTEEAYRHYALGQNLSLERERQRASLLDWSQNVLFSLHLHDASAPLPSLGRSEFGMWLSHKAEVIFERSDELEQIEAQLERVDSIVLPRLQQAADAGQRRLRSRELQETLDEIHFLLGTLFDRHVEVENGRDALTRLLNRRFLPAVLSREIQLHQRSQQQFGVLLIDLDHFKAINDTHGHEGGDRVLQQAAQLITACVRAGDFVFRYGGEEVLVVLVELGHDDLMRIAETLRGRFEAQAFTVTNGLEIRVSVSIGVALHDGHPDYQYLIGRADDALYRAKRGGRNRVVDAGAMA